MNTIPSSNGTATKTVNTAISTHALAEMVNGAPPISNEAQDTVQDTVQTTVHEPDSLEIVLQTREL